MLGLGSGVASAEFRLPELQPKIAPGALTLSGAFDLGLGTKAEEALAKGIPLEVVIDVRLYRHRTLLWNKKIGEWSFRRQVRYHALAGQYLVSAVAPAAGEGESFFSLTEALNYLGSLSDLILALPEPPDPEADYLVRVRAGLDIEALPAPLRPVAYTSPAWHLNSGWTVWTVPR